MISLRGIFPANNLDESQHVPTTIIVDHMKTTKRPKRTLVKKRIEFWQNRAVTPARHQDVDEDMAPPQDW
jgi:hypothetical protein